MACSITFFSWIIILVAEVMGLNDQLFNYDGIDGKQCSGGQPVGQPGISTAACASTCSASSTCTGFNFDKQSGTCAARSGCTESINLNWAYFRKRVPSANNITQTTAPNYTTIEGKRCTGGRTIGEGTQSEQCAKICDAVYDCLGYTLSTRVRLCTVRIGCVAVADENWTYLRKRTPSPQLEGFSTEAPTDTTPRPSPINAQTISSAPYDILERTWCTGGTQVGERSSSIDNCVAICNNTVTCIGFNFDKTTGTCAARSGCDISDNANVIFFRRRSSRLFGIANTPVPSRPTSAPSLPPAIGKIQSMGYTILDGKRCIRGKTIGEGLSPKVCAAICSENDDCQGFTVYKTATYCEVKLNCTILSSENWVFARKNQSSLAPHQSPASTEDGITIKPFQKVTGKRCSGGSVIGKPSGSTNDCATTCMSSNSCLGFSLDKLTGMCTAWSVCRESVDENSLFFRKTIINS